MSQNAARTAQDAPKGPQAAESPQNSAGAALAVQGTASSTPAALHLATIAPGSRRSVASSLRRAAKIAEGHPHADGIRYPWHRANAATLGAVRAGLAAFAPSTANASLAAIRGALRQAWITGKLSRDGLERRRAALKAVRGRSAPGRALNAAEVGKLFTACAKDSNRAAGARDAALLAALYGLGLRRAEAAAATLEDLDLTAGRWRIHGKGRRQRWAFLGMNGARAAVEGWLRHRGTEPGPLFAPVNRGGRVVEGAGMSGEAIRQRVALRGREAGLGKLAPHALRRSFATALLGAGNDLAVTADLMGHARTDTTRLYDRRGEDAAKQAAATIPVPYQEPQRSLINLSAGTPR